MEITRRNLLAGTAYLATGPANARAAENAAGPSQGELAESLGVLAGNRGKLVGSAFDVSVLSNPRYARLIKHHARILTTDNALKFSALRGSGPIADFSDADRVVAFAANAKLPVRGHCLVWNEWAPKWLFKETMARRIYWMDRHIDETAGRYAGRLHSWDVVNEPIWPEHNNPGALRGGPWYAAMGASYITRAFKRAAQADPTTKLVLNEAGTEWVSPRRDLFRKSIVDVIRKVRDGGGKVDAVGMECHWRPGLKFESAVLEDWIARLGEMKLEVYFTEIDVRTEKMPGSVPLVDQTVARFYGQLARVAVRRPEVKAFSTWQLADSENYMWGEDPAALRKPRPLPFDENYNPKTAYAALANAFRESPRA